MNRSNRSANATLPFEALHEQWLADSEGKRRTVSARICRDRDNPNSYVAIAEFASHAEAMANSDLPETANMASALAALADEPITFRNLDLLRET